MFDCTEFVPKVHDIIHYFMFSWGTEMDRLITLTIDPEKVDMANTVSYKDKWTRSCPETDRNEWVGIGRNPINWKME